MAPKKQKTIEAVEADSALETQTVTLKGKGLCQIGVNGSFRHLPRGVEVEVSQPEYQRLVEAGEIDQ